MELGLIVRDIRRYDSGCINHIFGFCNQNSGALKWCIKVGRTCCTGCSFYAIPCFLRQAVEVTTW